MEGEVKRGIAVPALTIDCDESQARRMARMIRENPVIVFSLRSCCMCHVMKRLLASVGVNVTVIEMDEAEVSAGGIIPPEAVPAVGRPVLFIGGVPIGGLENLIAMHLSGGLVPRLQKAGAIWV